MNADSCACAVERRYVMTAFYRSDAILAFSVFIYVQSVFICVRSSTKLGLISPNGGRPLCTPQPRWSVDRDRRSFGEQHRRWRPTQNITEGRAIERGEIGIDGRRCDAPHSPRRVLDRVLERAGIAL